MIYAKYTICEKCNKIYQGDEENCEQCGNQLERLWIKETIYFYIGLVFGLIGVVLGIYDITNIWGINLEYTILFFIIFFIFLLINFHKKKKVMNTLLEQIKNKGSLHLVPDNIFWPDREIKSGP